jgi:uncharacterized iron-regulated membrane protein
LNVRLPLLARRLHKWLALLLSVQILIWTFTGLYMVIIDLDIIHGDHLVKEPPHHAVPLAKLADPLSVASQVPEANGVRLFWRGQRPAYAVAAKTGTVTFDAATGHPLPAPSVVEIRRAARERLNGSAAIVSVALLPEAPFEIRGRQGPLWRVQFKGWNNPTFYLSAQTGELLSRRHELWRTFDLFFGLHVMDYWTREDVNNPLLRIVSWIATVMAVSGGWLLLYSLPRRTKRQTP